MPFPNLIRFLRKHSRCILDIHSKFFKWFLDPHGFSKIREEHIFSPTCIGKLSGYIYHFSFAKDYFPELLVNQLDAASCSDIEIVKLLVW
jgi:hypothetical protein